MSGINPPNVLAGVAGTLDSAAPPTPGLDAAQDALHEKLEELVGSDGPTLFTWLPGGALALTPAMVLTMTRSRLRDLDQQLHTHMNQLQTNTKMSEVLAAKQEALQEVRAAVAELKDDPNAKLDLSTHVMPDGRTAEKFLEDHGVSGVTGEQSLNSLDSHLDVLKSESRQMNSGNEMLMLAIQTLTQQRSQALQLGTSLMKKIDEGAMSVLRNI